MERYERDGCNGMNVDDCMQMRLRDENTTASTTCAVRLRGGETDRQ